MLRCAKVTALVTREEISEWEEADTGILAFWRVELQCSVFRLRAFMPALGLNHGPLLKSQRGAFARWVLQHSLPLLLKQIRHCIDSLQSALSRPGTGYNQLPARGSRQVSRNGAVALLSSSLAKSRWSIAPPWPAFSCDTCGLTKTGAPYDPYCSTWV